MPGRAGDLLADRAQLARRGGAHHQAARTPLPLPEPHALLVLCAGSALHADQGPAPPQRFLLTDIVVARPARARPTVRPGRQAAPAGLPSRETSRPGRSSATLEEASPAGSLPAARETSPGKVTREDYRRALQLLLQHTQILQQDRELLDLLLRQLTEPGPDVPGTGSGVAQAEVVEAGPPRASAPEPARPSPAAPLPAAAEPPPDQVRREEYRNALLVLLQHTEVLHGDRELVNLLLAQLTEAQYDERIVELAQVGRVPERAEATHVTSSPIPGTTLNHGTLTAAAPSSYER